MDSLERTLKNTRASSAKARVGNLKQLNSLIHLYNQKVSKLQKNRKLLRHHSAENGKRKRRQKLAQVQTGINKTPKAFTNIPKPEFSRESKPPLGRHAETQTDSNIEESTVIINDTCAHGQQPSISYELFLGAPCELFGEGGFKNCDTFGNEQLGSLKQISEQVLAESEQADILTSLEKADTCRQVVPMYAPKAVCTLTEPDTAVEADETLDTYESDDTRRMPSEIKENKAPESHQINGAVEAELRHEIETLKKEFEQERMHYRSKLASIEAQLLGAEQRAPKMVEKTPSPKRGSHENDLRLRLDNLNSIQKHFDKLESTIDHAFLSSTRSNALDTGSDRTQHKARQVLDQVAENLRKPLTESNLDCKLGQLRDLLKH